MTKSFFLPNTSSNLPENGRTIIADNKKPDNSNPASLSVWCSSPIAYNGKVVTKP